ncbi:MAG TPA: hydroxyphenylacetyl-CoA thioesterase PaaI [Burkholderiaceae bacterium]|nr:hydroxyphenylacetyl-CoA thioesterase PaaI [Burkholderiaceae bacterium]
MRSPTPATGGALTPQQIADAVRIGMYAADRASQALGITIDAMTPGRATLRMTVRPDMLNGLGSCHGGLITTLADSAFACACNSYNELTVASGLAIELLAPAHEGDVLVAAASEASRRGRLGIYDVAVTNQRGECVALMRGRSYSAKGKPTVELPATRI